MYVDKLTNNPTFRYSIKSNTTAILTVEYSTKMIIGNEFIYSDYDYEVELTFTSKTDGTYKGQEISNSKSNVVALNKKQTRTIYGDFIIY